MQVIDDCLVLTPETFDNKSSNNVYWSPKGRHVLLATLGSNSKFDIEFWDLDLEKEEGAGKEQQEAGAGIRLVTTVEHYGLTDIEWDPSGRFVATYGSMWMSTVRSIFPLANKVRRRIRAVLTWSRFCL